MKWASLTLCLLSLCLLPLLYLPPIQRRLVLSAWSAWKASAVLVWVAFASFLFALALFMPGCSSPSFAGSPDGSSDSSTGVERARKVLDATPGDQASDSGAARAEASQDVIVQDGGGSPWPVPQPSWEGVWRVTRTTLGPDCRDYAGNVVFPGRTETWTVQGMSVMGSALGALRITRADGSSVWLSSAKLDGSLTMVAGNEASFEGIVSLSTTSPTLDGSGWMPCSVMQHVAGQR